MAWTTSGSIFHLSGVSTAHTNDSPVIIIWTYIKRPSGHPRRSKRHAYRGIVVSGKSDLSSAKTHKPKAKTCHTSEVEFLNVAPQSHPHHRWEQPLPLTHPSPALWWVGITSAFTFSLSWKAVFFYALVLVNIFLDYYWNSGKKSAQTFIIF